MDTVTGCGVSSKILVQLDEHKSILDHELKNGSIEQLSKGLSAEM